MARKRTRFGIVVHRGGEYEFVSGAKCPLGYGECNLHRMRSTYCVRGDEHGVHDACICCAGDGHMNSHDVRDFAPQVVRVAGDQIVGRIIDELYARGLIVSR